MFKNVYYINKIEKTIITVTITTKRPLLQLSCMPRLRNVGAAIRVELCGTAIVFWGDSSEDRVVINEKLDVLDQFEGECNKEEYIQRVVLLEHGTTRTMLNN